MVAITIFKQKAAFYVVCYRKEVVLEHLFNSKTGYDFLFKFYSFYIILPNIYEFHDKINDFQPSV